MAYRWELCIVFYFQSVQRPTTSLLYLLTTSCFTDFAEVTIALVPRYVTLGYKAFALITRSLY